MGLAGDSGLAIGLEVTSVCDARCVFCTYRLGFRAPHSLTLDEFRRRASTAVAFGFRALELTPVTGELFVHPDAVAFIREAKRLGFASVRTYSNGILLHRHGAKSVLESGLEALSISFPGFGKQIYREIYGVDKYDEFELSIRELLKVHFQIRSKVIISFDPRTYLTEEQIRQEPFYRDVLAPHIGDTVRVNKPTLHFDSWCGSVQPGDMPAGMRIDAVPLKSLAPLKKVHACAHLFFLGVLANGDVRLCNCRYDKTIQTEGDSLLLGNLATTNGDIGEFLKTACSKVARVREDFRSGHLPGACRSCSFYLPVKHGERDALF